MRRFSSLCILLVLVQCFSGCIVQSLNPFYTADAVIECPLRTGEWEMIDHNEKSKKIKPWVFENDKITVYDENGASGIVKVVYFKLENTLFLDATVEEPDKNICSWWLMNLTPVHTVCRIKTQDNNLIITPIDFEYISEAVENKTFNLSYTEKKEWDAFLITASSQDLLKFLYENKQSNDMFSETHAMKFVLKNKP